MPPEQDVLDKPEAEDAVVDKTAADSTSEKPTDDKSASGKGAAADGDAAANDGADADADEKAGESKGAAETKEAAPAAESESAKDDAVKDAAWRSRIVEKLLAPLKDKISATKFEKRREQLTEQIKRYKSPEDAIISGLNAQEKLRSGDHRKAPDGGSEEEIAAWRKENGIPATVEDIQIPNVPGKEWGDADQPAIDGFRGVAFKAGLNQEQVNELVRFQVQETQRIEAEYEAGLKKADKQDREACHDALRTEYGVAEFKPNMAIMNRLFDDNEVFGEVKAELVSARYFNTETGTWHRLTSHPAMARAFIGLATDRYGDGAMAGADGRTSTGNRVAELEKLRDTDYAAYVRSGGADELMKIHQADEARAAKRSKR